MHGLSAAFLADKPVFAAVAAEFAAFLGDARLVIHNAAFDMQFLNAELGWAGQAGFAWARAVDTLELARRRFPGAQNSLDALCRRFGVDNSGREKHGALLDSELLAEVYLELMGGRQPDLMLTVVTSGAGAAGAIWVPPPRPRPLRAAAHARPRPRRTRASWPSSARTPSGSGSDRGSGLGRGLRLGLAPRQLRPVERQEVDLIEVQRRIAAVAGHVADDAAQVGEDQPRALDHQERVQLLRRHVLDQEQPGIVELEDEDLGLGRPSKSTLSFSATS